MKIGIFGGSFNPPHKMHEEIVLELLKKGILDRVICVPTGDYYKKNELIHIDNRITMLDTLFKNNKNVIVSEISRDRKYEYTYQVLDYFKSLYKNTKIYFICGSDNFKEFKKWKKYEYIFHNYQILVINRNGCSTIDLLKSYSKYKERIVFTDIACSEISSTIIRKSIKIGKYKEIENIIDKEVLKYILENHLYGGEKL